MAKFGGGHFPLGVITRLAGDRQVRHAIGAIARLGNDVLDLQRDVRLAAIRAAALELLQQIFPHFVARQLPMLVLHSSYFSVLHELGVELHQLQRERADRRGAAQALNPRHHVADPRLQRRWKPAGAASTVEEAGGAIVGVARSPAATDGPPRQEGVTNPLPSVGKFRCPHHVPSGVVDHGQPGGLAPWIKLQPQRRGLVNSFALLHDDGEREAAPDGCAPPVQEMPRPPGMDRGARLLCLVNDQHIRHCNNPFGLPLRG
jgi:hypothetical protein